MRSERTQNDEKIAPLPSAEGLFRPLDFSTLAGSPRSVRWLVDGYIPRGSCVLFSGPTKIGKSYVLQHLMTCLALGVPWFGHATERCKVFGLFCEEDAPPLHWRRDQILHYLDAAPEDFEAGGFMGYPRRGQANHLVRFDRRTDQGQMTPLWDKLKFAVREKYGSQFVLLDTSRQVFDGDENRASQVTVFLNELNRFAEEIDGCVVITQQPAKAVDSMFAGSGAWAATARTHLHLSRPDEFDWSTREHVDERVLRNMGANYSGGIPDMALRWDPRWMMFVVDEAAGQLETAGGPTSFLDRIEFDGRVLQAARSMVEDNAWLVADPGSRLSIAARLVKTAAFSRSAPAALRAAQDRLVDAGKLVRITIGKGASAAMVLRPADMRYANEPAP